MNGVVLDARYPEAAEFYDSSVLVCDLPLGVLVLDVDLQLARNISKISVVVPSPLRFKHALLKVANKRSSCMFDCRWYGDVRIF